MSSGLDICISYGISLAKIFRSLMSSVQVLLLRYPDAPALPDVLATAKTHSVIPAIQDVINDVNTIVVVCHAAIKS